MNATTSLSISVTAFAMLMAAATAQPALGADPYNGERLAQRWCSACHVVTSSQREANADAPPFEEIAKRPNFNERPVDLPAQPARQDAEHEFVP